MKRSKIDLQQLMANLDALSRFGLDERGFRYRPTFSESYEAARHWISGLMNDAGLTVRSDAAGNLIGRVGPPGPCLMCGSHFDTVPGGGPLDGALGIIAGIACAEIIGAQSALPIAIEVVAFADEEGNFGDFSGSAAMIEGMSIDSLGAAERWTLESAMKTAGFSISALPRAKRSPSDIFAYLELHIEQGPLLEAAGIPIGIVDVIVGIHRCDIVFTGEAAHSGTTPMAMRHDAIRAAAAHIQRASQEIEQLGGPDARINFGMISVLPGATNVVPGEVTLRQEIRHPDYKMITTLKDCSAEVASIVANRFRCGFHMVDQGGKPPVRMDIGIRQTISEVATELRLSSTTLPSGAGHDAQTLGMHLPAGMIFVPSEGGRSHRPDEHTSPDLLENGANVLLGTLSRLVETSRSSLRSGNTS